MTTATLEQNGAPAGASLGTILADAREKRGLSVEEAAKLTRIRAQLIRDIEADDLGRFSHPSYARMFLLDYSKFLGVPAESIQDQLPDSGAYGVQEYQYLNNLELFRNAKKPPAREQGGKFAGNRAVAIFTKLVAVCAILAILGYGYVQFRNLNRLELGAPASVAPAPVEEVVLEQPGVPVGEADAVPLPDAPPAPDGAPTPASLWAADESFLLLEQPAPRGLDEPAAEESGVSLESEVELEFNQAADPPAGL